MQHCHLEIIPDVFPMMETLLRAEMCFRSVVYFLPEDGVIFLVSAKLEVLTAAQNQGAAHLFDCPRLYIRSLGVMPNYLAIIVAVICE